jgi:tetratricopeptide (TPR) repeat protein
LNKIQGGVEGLHTKFDQILFGLHNAKGHNVSNTPGMQHMPGKPGVFHGREQLVQELAHLLSEETTSRVCILGPGGMGKTSLALAVAESPLVQSRYASRRFWVPCVEATSPAVFLQLLYVHLQIKRSSGNILDDILAELNSSNKPRLILLDNFETPWIPVEGPRHQVDNVLRRLGQIRHVALLVTMRGAEPPCDDIVWQSKDIEPVDKEAARIIFHDIYPKSKDDHNVDDLLAALGYLPFAVILMAKVGRKSRSSARALLDEWSRVGTGMISRSSSREDNMNRSISLSVDRDFVQQDPDALILLSTLSLLPAGTLRTNLHWWAPNLKSIASAVATLSDAALLMTRNNSTETLFVLPVIQSFMLTNDRIPSDVHQQVREACCRYVSDHACRYYDHLFKGNAQALATEDTNIQSILLKFGPNSSSVPLDEVVETLLHFTWYRFDTRPSIEIANYTLELAKSSGNDRYIVEALTALGSTHHRFDGFKVAEKYLEEGYQYYDKPTVDQRVIVECGRILADVRYHLGYPVQHIIPFLRDLQSNFGATMGDLQHAKIMVVLGLIHKRAGQYSEALSMLLDAIEMFKVIKNFPDVARSMIFIAQIYRHTSRLTDALKNIAEAENIMEHLDHRRICSRIKTTYGSILVDLNRHTEAIPKFEEALLIDHDIGRNKGVACNLESLGFVYVCRGDYQDASAAYEAAIEKYMELGQEAFKSQTHRCKRNLDKIKQNDDEMMDISMLIERQYVE